MQEEKELMVLVGGCEGVEKEEEELAEGPEEMGHQGRASVTTKQRQATHGTHNSQGCVRP